MSIELSESVKVAIDFIIKSKNYTVPPEISVTRGSEVGDGYSSKNYAVSIDDKSGETVNLFVKCLPDAIPEEYREFSEQGFQYELKFYSEIYPTFSAFQETRNISIPFNNAPKFYETNIKNYRAPLLIVENLRNLGYKLHHRMKPLDDEHLKLAIKVFARYHAISYAMKDQEPEMFQKLSTGILDLFTEGIQKFGMLGIVTNIINQFLENLDQDIDKKILDHCKNLANVLAKFMANIPHLQDEYVVLCHGDSWCSNMMFLYDEESKSPIDVKLIDWQCQRVLSPLFDFSYFFYTVATKEILDNGEFYLNLYYETLSQRITDLGSDPEEMYPRKVFEDHWKKFSPFGLFMAFYIVKTQVFEADEVPDIVHCEKSAWEDSFSREQKHHGTYVNRMKAIVEYFIENKLI